MPLAQPNVLADDDRITLFQAAVAKGDVQIDQGEGVVYTPELMASLAQTAINEMHSG
jgi:hypothetical protein